MCAARDAIEIWCEPVIKTFPQSCVRHIGPVLFGESFAQHRDTVALAKLEKDKNLSEETARHWRRIEDGTLDFDRTARVVAAVRALTKADAIAFCRDFILVGGAKRAKLAAHVYGRGHAVPEAPAAGEGASPTTVHVSNEIDFRRSMPLFPSAL